jgi:mRNA-degrading endonuclease RelE of RelBE toxin-antitoxin system
MPKTILLSKIARKQLDSLPEDTRNKVKKALYSINEPEKSKMLDTKKLKGVRGREDLFRLRIGNYRCLF